MAFKIINDPLPPRGNVDGVYCALRQLEVGQSFIVPFTGAQYQRHGLYTSAKRVGIKVTTREVEGGFQVWRTA